MTAKIEPDLAALAGSWRLVSAMVQPANGGEPIAPWGDDPNGRMMIDPSGRISFIMTSRNRRFPGTEAARARLFGDLLAFSGALRSDGPGRFVATIDVAKNPAMVGQSVIRTFSLDGVRLHLRTAGPEGEQPEQRRPGSFDAVLEREFPADA